MKVVGGSVIGVNGFWGMSVGVDVKVMFCCLWNLF